MGLKYGGDSPHGCLNEEINVPPALERAVRKRLAGDQDGSFLIDINQKLHHAKVLCALKKQVRQREESARV